jgi:predicted RNase H-like nuclease (RuvC/YqgF family)
MGLHNFKQNQPTIATIVQDSSRVTQLEKQLKVYQNEIQRLHATYEQADNTKRVIELEKQLENAKHKQAMIQKAADDRVREANEANDSAIQKLKAELEFSRATKPVIPSAAIAADSEKDDEINRLKVELANA